MSNEQYFCRDCKKEIKIDKDKNLINGKVLVYDTGDGKKMSVIKCDECYEKNSSLMNYQECEVYSRVVGYLRPVKQWNNGKQQEYKERKVFKTKA